MSFEDFIASVRAGKKPAGPLTPALEALWHDGSGNWEAAHGAAQDDSSRDGSWVHAYLHRKEGDLGNAGYWYSRAGRPAPARSVTLDAEWESIARELFAR